MDFSMVAGEKNRRGGLWCFSGVFAKTVVQNVVFCWCDRGGLRGKRGVLTRYFLTIKNTPILSILFW
jgi:hypothetical protein